MLTGKENLFASFGIIPSVMLETVASIYTKKPLTAVLEETVKEEGSRRTPLREIVRLREIFNMFSNQQQNKTNNQKR